MPVRRPRGWQLPFEWTMACIVLCAIGYSFWFLAHNGYLPMTFFYEPDDVFADWFNTAYWAYDKGAYDTWTTLYPPVSFVFLGLITRAECYPIRGIGSDLSVGLAARYCDWGSYVWIGGLFLLNIVLVYLVLRKADRTTAIPRTIAVALGWPALNGLERGNLVLVAFTLFVLGFGPLLRSAWLKWLCVGLAVNFKVYLIGTVVAPLLKRRWRWSEGALIAVVVVYLVSFALLGRGSLFELIGNLQNWSALGAASPLDMWSASTYESLYKLLDSEQYPMAAIIGSDKVILLHWLIPALLNATRLTIVFAAIATWLRPEVVPTYRVVNFALMMALISSEAGGYTSAFFIFLVMFEPWRGFGRKFAIVLCYLLAQPIDFPIDHIADVVRDTFFGHSTTIISFYIKLGPFIRPLMIELVAAAISFVTIRDVWIDIHQQGWSGRWRYRRDVPFLPWIRKPLPPGAGTRAAGDSTAVQGQA
nr:glycosyltransferase family 87 protein [Novosphingobium profundi]